MSRTISITTAQALWAQTMAVPCNTSPWNVPKVLRQPLPHQHANGALVVVPLCMPAAQILLLMIRGCSVWGVFVN